MINYLDMDIQNAKILYFCTNLLFTFSASKSSLPFELLTKLQSLLFIKQIFIEHLLCG